jgi:hypothetical protein
MALRGHPTPVQEVTVQIGALLCADPALITKVILMDTVTA